MEKSKLIPLLKVNDTFPSYEAFRKAVEKYEKANRVQFWTRDGKRLHRASPSVYEIVKFHPELEYCSLKLSCIHGGKSFQQKKNVFTKSLRKDRGTWRQDCKAEIFVKLNEEKNRLIISRMDEEHNHDIPMSDVFQQIPKTRRISDKRRITKKNFSESKFHQRLHETDGIRLENIVKSNSLSRSKNFEKIANILKEKYCCNVDLQSDENDKIYGFFFQDNHMKKCFELFPEFLIIDGTYTLQNIRCCIYIFSVKNAMDLNDIVGVGVLTSNDRVSVDWMLGIFKDENPQYENTAVVLTDKQSKEYEISSHFHNATDLICSSHALNSFKKDIRDKFLTPSEVRDCLEFFEKLSSAESDEEYNTVLEDMEDNMPYSVTQYFYKTWHDLRHLWVKGFSTIQTYVKMKLDDPSSKFRSTISSCKTFSIFIEKLFPALYFRRNEVKRHFNKIVMKVFVKDEATKAEKSYNKYLTPSAFDKIKHHIHAIEKDFKKFDFEVVNGDTICQTKDGCFVVSEFSCVCDFFTIMKLPCEHVLAYRKAQKMSLFDEYLFSQRWTRRSMKILFENNKPMAVRGGKCETSIEEKFQQAESVCLSLAALCSEASGVEFEKRIDLLMQIKRSWENHDSVIELKEFADEVQSEVEIIHGDLENTESMDFDAEGGSSENIILEVIS